MGIGIPGVLDMITDSFILSMLIPISIICLGGAIPHYLESRRIDSLSKALPEALESISTSLGAGLGLQQAVTTVAKERNDLFGEMLNRAVERSAASSFDAALSEFALNTRCPPIQRAIGLLQTANDSEAPLRDVTFSMSLEFEKFYHLRSKRVRDLGGQAFMLKVFMCIVIPVTMGAMFGLFAGPTTGVPMGSFHLGMLLFMISSGLFAVVGGAIMIGKETIAAIWWAPFWAFVASFVYMGSYMGASIFI